jgi:hypothetical protein
MINSLETPSTKTFVFLLLSIVFIFIFVYLEIKAHELAKSLVKLKLISAVHAQDDSHK